MKSQDIWDTQPFNKQGWSARYVMSSLSLDQQKFYCIQTTAGWLSGLRSNRHVPLWVQVTLQVNLSSCEFKWHWMYNQVLMLQVTWPDLVTTGLWLNMLWDSFFFLPWAASMTDLVRQMWSWNVWTSWSHAELNQTCFISISFEEGTKTPGWPSG